MLRPLPQRRAAFTLIELLVVIAIIAVLASLLLVGIMSMLSRGVDAKEINDIHQLAISLNAFKADKKCYPPSRIVLYASYDDYFKNLNGDKQLDFDSLQAINRIWPNIGKFTYINWASTTNALGYPANGIILEADQCLVWALGGVYVPPPGGGMVGFSTNPKNPAVDNAVGERKRYFDFPAGRLNTTRTANHAVFPSFNDNYTSTGDAASQRPFIYFAVALAGSNTPNTYNDKHAITITYNDGRLPLADVISPYFANPKKYWNPTTFQIISAGKDGRFGALGEWNDGTSPVADTTWRDNRTNWSSKVLGAVAQ